MPTAPHNAQHLPTGPLVDLATHELAEKLRRRVQGLVRGYSSIWPDYEEDRWFLTDYAKGRLVADDCSECVRNSIHRKRRQIRALERAGGLYGGHKLFVVLKDGAFRLLNGHNTVAQLIVLQLPVTAIWIDAPENQ